MARTIRRGCFETNSSSMHSIAVTKNDVHVTPEEIAGYNSDEYVYIGKNGSMWFWNIDEGYGRSPFDVLTTFKDKLQYAMCELLGYKHADDPEYDKIYGELIAITQKLIPEFTQFDITKRHEDIYLDEDGNHVMQKDLIYDGWDEVNLCPHYIYLDENGDKHKAVLDEENVMEEPNIGMIDHQSAGMLTRFLATHNVSLEEFLTNKKYTIIIDGDEYCTWSKMQNSGLINQSAIVEEYR